MEICLKGFVGNVCELMYSGVPLNVALVSLISPTLYTIIILLSLSFYLCTFLYL